MQRSPTHGRSFTAVVIAFVASGTLAACGGSSPSGSNATGTSAAALHAASLKFAACVRAHGAPDFPDPPSSNDVGQQIRATPSKMTVDGHTLVESPRVIQTAMRKCQKYSPAAKGPPISAAQLAKIKAGALAMAKCMRANGVPNFPDPQVGTGPGGHGVSIGIQSSGRGSEGARGAGFNPQSPTFRAAQKRCQPLMSKALPSPTAKKG
jgi:hypothetical protein